MFAALWNVHSLVECVGDARICGVSKIANQNVYLPVDCKLSLLVHELQRYCVTMAGIQETKWFGLDV